MIAPRHVVGSGGGIRLLDETLHRIPALAHRLALLDIAVPGVRAGRRDAERHQLAGLGQRQRHREAGMKRGNIFNQMIRRQHQQNRVAGLVERLAGRQRNRWRGIAPMGSSRMLACSMPN